MNGEQLVRLHIIYTSALFRSIRVVVLFVILFLFGFQKQYHASVYIPLFLLIWFLIVEIFFHFHVYRYHPTLPLSKNTDKKLLLSTSHDALRIILSSPTTQNAVAKLYYATNAASILEKVGVSPEEIAFVDVPMQNVLDESAELVKAVRGEYITTMDLLTAYLLLTEPQTKVLFQHEVKEQEVLQILSWMRYLHTDEEFPRPIRMRFTDEGIGEGLINGWTPETKNYTTEFNYKSQAAFLIGRETQYKMLLEALSKQENNNVLLVGAPGVGKENLVAQLDNDSYEGHLSAYLNHKRILELMVGPLIAGIENRSELELRLESIVAEISHANNIILYIPDLENLMGSSSFGIDVSGALLPYLRTGNLPVIATMSSENYKIYLERNPLHEVFTTIQVEEPSKDVAFQMLTAKTPSIEEANGVLLTYRAIIEAAQLADRYEQDAALPGSAVTLLTDSANSVRISPNAKYYGKTKRKMVLGQDVQTQVSQKAHVNVGTPTAEEKDLLLHLEDKIHERVIDQVQAIKAISEALRRLRSGLTTSTRPISFLFLGPTGVGKSETAKALASVYFGGEDNMIRLDMSEYADADAERRLLGSAPGEGNERGELTDKIHDHPYSLVLLDEFEKASPKILDLFLQVLEDGRLTDNKGKTVSFVNSIIIATSNAGAEFIREHLTANAQIDKAFQQQLLEYLQQNQIFKPELLNRFDDVVTFAPLGPDALKQIVILLLTGIAKQLAEQDITITFDEKVLEKIVHDGADIEFGARPLRRYIQDQLEDLIAQKKLKDEIKRGSKVQVTTDATNAIAVIVTA